MSCYFMFLLVININSTPKKELNKQKNLIGRVTQDKE